MLPPFQTPHFDYNPEESMEETQQATQSTQSSSQQNPNNTDANAHLWGFLQPCGSQLRRIDFFKIVPTVRIGRHQEGNEVVLPGGRVSNKHCRIIWDGKEDEKSAVIVADYSSNGTWINGVRIGKDKTAILKEGNEIAFGTPQPQPGSLEDYRFIYRHTAAGPPKKGIHAFYDISHELGKGSFATVMKAISRATGQWYAIKMIQESRIRRAAAQDNSRQTDKDQKDCAFIREISILETLDHVNICKLKEVFREGDNIDLVLEYVDGGDLLEFILKNNGLNEPMAIHITRQICEALAYIHGKGIAHRDLKPENVLLTSENPPVVKVADFGLAKVVDSLTFLKTMCGTPSYLAPEVVTQNSDEGYSHLVDSWSVGVIVFSMLTSSSPFIEDDTQRDIKIRIAERVIDWGTLDVAGVSDLAKDFIRELLEYDPLKRLSLTAARRHPWLNQNRPASQPREIHVDSSVASFGPVGSSLTSLPDEDIALMDAAIHDDEIDGDGPGGMQTKLEKLQLNQQQRNGRHALQRRSQVLAEAAEHEMGLPEPSWQMLNTAGALPPLRAAKRKLGEGAGPSGDGEQGLSIVMEGVEGNNDWSIVDGNAIGHRNGGRKPDSAGASTTPGRAVRGSRVTRGKARGGRLRLHDVAAGMLVEEEHGSEGEVASTKPRRSTRHSPAKVPRRS
ncbi:kinase-like domain-containing protein [Scleroderma yunnanense]